MAHPIEPQPSPMGAMVPTRAARIGAFRDRLLAQRARLSAITVIVGAVLIFAGIRLMHDNSPFTIWPGLPAFTLGDEFGNPQWVALGTVVLLAGSLVVAFGLLCPKAIATRDRDGEIVSPTTPFPRPPSRRAMAAGVCMSIVALAAYRYVLICAPSHQSGIGVLLCLAAAAILATLSLTLLLPAGRRRAMQAFPSIAWQDGAITCAVCLAFIFAMLYDVRYWFYAFWGDEWSFFDVARDIASGNPMDFLSQAGVYGVHPVANSAYTALIMRVFGMNVAGWRLSTILSVVAAVPPLYLLGMVVGGRATAIAAAVIYADCHLLWAFSHIGYNNDDPLLVIVAAAALLFAGLRGTRLHLLFASGACAGAAWYTLYTGRLMIGILVVILLTEWDGGWRAVARRLGALLCGFGVVVLPLVVHNGANTVNQMFPQISFSHAHAAGSLPSLIQTNTIRGFYAFFYATENLHYVIGEVFDAVSAAALCVGLVVALRHVWDLCARLLLIWFVLGLMLTMPLFYADHIADTRIQLAIPPPHCWALGDSSPWDALLPLWFPCTLVALCSQSASSCRSRPRWR